MVTIGNVKYSLFIKDSIHIEDNVLDKMLDLPDACEADGGVFGNYVVFNVEDHRNLDQHMHHSKIRLEKLIKGCIDEDGI